ncbi:MAG TPA: hypothetical protein VGU45_06295 [Microvirga sp.]|nr:hypothetical protein [Microvirga sp.]
MAYLDSVRLVATAWLQSVVAYAMTLPPWLLAGLALPVLAALVARSVGALMISLLLAVVAVTIPESGPSGRYQYSTLILLILSGLATAFVGRPRGDGKAARVRALAAELDEAKRQIALLELKQQREKIWRPQPPRSG